MPGGRWFAQEMIVERVINKKECLGWILVRKKKVVGGSLKQEKVVGGGSQCKILVGDTKT